MSTFKHTPGPWTAEGAGRQIHTSSGTFYLDYRTNDKTGNRAFKSPTELDRNVHLVAAAPEMLAALEKIVSSKSINTEAILKLIAKARHGEE